MQLTQRIVACMECDLKATLGLQATRIAAEAYRLGIATQIEPKDLKDLIRRSQYDHLHNFTYSDSAFDNLEKEFMTEMQ